MTMIIRPECFGAVGDGASDDAPALLAMRDFMLLNNERRYVVELKPGAQYDYSNNRWLRNVNYVHVKGNGAKLRCVRSTFSFDRDLIALLLTSMVEDYEDIDYPGDENAVISGYLIKGAVQGGREFTLLDPNNSPCFEVGEWVCVHGFVQQFQGLPQNLRYFDYKRIAGVDPATGIVTLDSSLEYDYFDATTATPWYDHADFAYNAGLPRVIPLNRPKSNVTKSLKLSDVEFLANPTTDPPLAHVNLPALNIHMVNVKTPGNFAPSMCRHITAKSCHFKEAIEIDKLISYAAFDDCVIGGEIAAGTGAVNVIVRNCLIEKFARLGVMRNLLVDSCTILNRDGIGFAPLQEYYSVTSSRLVEISRCNIGRNFTGPLTAASTKNFIVSEFDENIGFLFEDNSVGRNVVQTVQIGTELFADHDLTGSIGVVENMYFLNDRHILAGGFSNILVGQNVYYGAWQRTVSRDNFFNGVIEERQNG